MNVKQLWVQLTVQSKMSWDHVQYLSKLRCTTLHFRYGQLCKFTILLLKDKNEMKANLYNFFLVNHAGY